jgi:hypothetical protein
MRQRQWERILDYQKETKYEKPFYKNKANKTVSQNESTVANNESRGVLGKLNLQHHPKRKFRSNL